MPIAGRRDGRACAADHYPHLLVRPTWILVMVGVVGVCPKQLYEGETLRKRVCRSLGKGSQLFVLEDKTDP